MRTVITAFLSVAILATLLVAQPTSSVTAVPPDGGMWTFDNPPTAILKQKYGFELTPEWLEKVRLGAVRVSTGGSGSFVSKDGLVMTNHHVALELVGKLSTTDRDLVKDGYLAKTRAEELRCPEAEIRHLKYQADVTAEVAAIVGKAKSNEEKMALLAEAQSTVAKDHAGKTGLVVDIVSLYGGGQYMAYGYKTWNDVRLVFAPEMRIAYFGGDYDNFVYPRYCLDAAFLRVYENGEPANTADHFFRWNPAGPSKDELVFVAGHPGDTGRLLPMSTLRFERDIEQPVQISFLKAEETSLLAISKRSEADRLKVLDRLFGVRNSLKAMTGQQEGLMNAALMAKKEAEEADLRARIQGNAAAEQAFQDIEAAEKVQSETFPILVFGRTSPELRGYSKALRDLGDNLQKPAADRAKGFSGQELLDKVRSTLEANDARGAEWSNLLANLERFLGRDAASLAKILGGKSAADRAKDLLPNLGDGASALLASLPTDAEAAEKILAPLGAELSRSGQALRELERDLQAAGREAAPRFQAARAKAAAQMPILAAARFDAYGKSVPPDATFTLRLTFGRAVGYELGTTLVPWKTTFFGLFARSAEFDGEEPFNLPPSWTAAKSKLDLSTPFNFVSTCDIIGGNSGSPVLNQKAEVVGLIFDGNIQSLPGRYSFDESVNRALSVHSSGITEALRTVYSAKELLAELGVQ